jgi:NAD(P)-dependent dehydrogenase (short-subunit alcohol dehydrogenase family)
MKIVVVGASSGLGRYMGIAFAQRGDQVALLARRKDKLEDAAEEAGGNALPIVCDVTDEASCRSAIDEAASGLGGIDGLLYTAGAGPLAKLVDTDGATWRQALDTNVIGTSLVTAAAIPHLTESGGVAAYLSSVSASSPSPWPGLGAYITSKAALEKLVECWRVEHPQVGFTRITVGNCPGGQGDAMTQFNSGWDMDLAAELGMGWMSRGYITADFLDVEDLLRVVTAVLESGASACIPSVTVVPRGLV